MRGIGANYGFHVTDAMISKWWQGGVSPSMIQQRFSSLSYVRNNQTYFKQFNLVLRQAGLIKGNMNKAQELSIAAGTAEPQWLNLWGKAAVRGGLEMAGVGIGTGKGDLTLTRQQAYHIEGQLGRDAVIGATAGVQKVYQSIAQHLQTLPAARVSGLGFSKADVIQLDTGGPRAAQLAARYTQIMANTKAAASTTPGALGPPQGQPTGYTAGSQ